MSAEATPPASGHVPAPPAPAAATGRARFELFVASFAILFLELACIRWFGSMVVFLSFFTNLVLMACFLGMSVGCLAAARRRNLVQSVLPLLCVTMLLAYATLYVYSRYDQLVVEVGSAERPQQVYFGTDFKLKDPSSFVVPIEAVAGLFFTLVALVFVGLGQTLGRAFAHVGRPILAYSLNVLGSMVGIVAFGAVSYWHTPPLVWFGVCVVCAFLLVKRITVVQVLAALGLLGLLAAVELLEPKGVATTWSPYYKVQFFGPTRTIYVNNMFHQAMALVSQDNALYTMPYMLARDAGAGSFDDVLVIGAGSGNDVSAAVQRGAQHVDAVEIDPVINRIGRLHHPERPFSNPRVTVHLDDGRGFVRRTDKKYDLVVYALVDSLVLHSGYSSLRLESFLFTEQALRDIKEHLKPDGVLIMYNYFRQGWVLGRLDELCERIFGARPIVISEPYQDKIGPETTLRGHLSYLIVGTPGSKVIEAIRKKFANDQFFWENHSPRVNEAVNGYGLHPPEVAGAPAESWTKIGPAQVDVSDIGPLPTDDWPFLYLRAPAIPALNLRGMAIVAGLSLVMLFLFSPVRLSKLNPRMVCLGAGFMLLETRGVVQMALLFGSTWIVNSVVFFAVLAMILVSNLTVALRAPRSLRVWYVLLIAALLASALVPATQFLALTGPSRTVASCAVFFLPVYFAGVIFAASFGKSRQSDVDFGSNILGVIVGGLSEYFSLVLGFQHLLFLAVAYYLLSAVFGGRRQAAGSEVQALA